MPFVCDSVTVAGEAGGPLAGARFVAKDLFAVAGHVSSFGSARWRATHEAAPGHAEAVARLLACGATLAGLTALDQLAYSVIGNVNEGAPPPNPRRPDRFAGGSSSGTASAVAAGLADFGVGTDTAGSIRVPAAACGLFALRPTHGALSLAGAIPLAASFDTLGLCARSVAPVVGAYEVMADAPDPGGEIVELLLPTDVLAEHVAGGAIARRARALAARAGLRLTEVRFAAFPGEEAAALLSRLQGTEIHETHGAWVALHGDALDPDVRARLERCRAWAARSAVERRRDEDERRRFSESLGSVLDGRRAVVLPVLPGPMPLRTAGPEELRDFRARTLRLTAAASLAGMPQAVLPGDGEGGEESLGLLAARGADRALLRLLAR